jgi:hypothetical protein
MKRGESRAFIRPGINKRIEQGMSKNPILYKFEQTTHF